MSLTHEQENLLFATVDLVGRSGATSFEFGYLHDDVPLEDAAWWAHAQYRGARIGVENQRGPIHAVVALAARLLTGAQCWYCKRLVALTPEGAFAYDSAHLIDGTVWNAADAIAAGQCVWHLHEAKWVRGCETEKPGGNRAQRRSRRRRS